MNEIKSSSCGCVFEVAKLFWLNNSFPENHFIGIKSSFINDHNPHYHYYDSKSFLNSKKIHIEFSITTLPDLQVVKITKGTLTKELKSNLQDWLLQPHKHLALNQFLNWQVLVLEWVNEYEGVVTVSKAFENSSPDILELLNIYNEE